MAEVFDMRLSFDPRYNVAYIRFQERTAEVETVRVTDELNVDLASDGTVYGIELLNANRQLRADGTGKMTVIDEASGECRRASAHK